MLSFREISGIGEKKEQNLKDYGINSPKELLLVYPRNYEDRSKVFDKNHTKDGDKITVIGIIASKSPSMKLKSGLQIIKLRVISDGFSVEVSLFNQNYLAKTLKIGEEYAFFGTVKFFGGKITLNSPQIEIFSEKSLDIRPIYPKISGINQLDIRKICYDAIKKEEIDEIIPKEILERYKLLPIKQALICIHFPKNSHDILKAKRRISFENLFLYMLKLEHLKSIRQNIKSFSIENTDFSDMSIPFSLTNAQKRSVDECIRDLTSGYKLNRLLQGDVGSGKTIVALILAYILAKNCKQVAFMVPTEILANQHFNDFKALNLGINIELLTGSTKAKDKKLIKQRLLNGEIDIILGTHAIISEDVKFFDLGLCIIDEQHRFGVMQRAKLLSKGDNPHILVMSATPIPRTLALILYADLDLSVIDEMPKGRLPVKTLVLDESSRKKINSFIKKQVLEKRQIYIVCPLIEENETLDVKDATNYYENMKVVFKDFNVALVHGKLKQAEKDKIMDKFKSGNIDILISTTVIEVGVNVPNATTMVIENAERFGLSALHQLRGRVGRSNIQSYCMLVSQKDSERLMILESTTDGFEISKEDLKLRGSGEFFGTRQHGSSELSIENIDVKMLKYAHLEAQNIINDKNAHKKYEKLLSYILDELINNKSNIFN